MIDHTQYTGICKTKNKDGIVDGADVRDPYDNEIWLTISEYTDKGVLPDLEALPDK